jgi:hypothetical protein
MWGLVLTLGAILALIGFLVLVIYSLSLRERLLNTGESSVYAIDFSITEAQQYESFKSQTMREVACKSSMTDTEFREFIKTQIPDGDRRKLKALLVKRLMACIDPIRKLQADKQGLPALAQRKLVSEEYLESFTQAERTLNEEFELIMSEADALESNWSKTIFSQAVQFWRLEQEKKQRPL